MRDLARILEREGASVDLGPDAFDDLLHRGRSKQRRQRITAVVVVVILLGGLLAAAWSAARQMQPQPGAPDLTDVTVGSLQELWSFDTGGVAAPPVTGSGIVATVTNEGRLLAFPAVCEAVGGSCQPLWTAEVGPMRTTQDPLHQLGGPVWLDSVGPPNGPSPGRGAVIVDGTVYTVSSDGTLYAFATTCADGGGACTPLWTAHVDDSANWLPQEMDGVVYLGTTRYVYAFRDCPIDGSTCAPAWRVPGNAFLRAQDGALYDTNTERGLVSSLDPETGATIWTGGPGTGGGPCCGNWPMPVRSGDTVYVSFGTELDAFPAACSGRCDPSWVGEIPDPFYNGPVVADGGVTLTVANADGSVDGLLTFPVDCRNDGGTCTAFHRTVVNGSELTTVGPVIADDTLIAVSTRSAGVFAFDPSCLASQDDCPQLWDALVLAPDQPVQVADVVFVADGSGPLRAFPIACKPQAPPQSPSSPSRCLPLWESSYLSGGSPAVLGGVVFATDVGGVLHASGLAAGASDGSRNASPGAPIPLLVAIGIALTLWMWALIQRRRRHLAL